MADDPPATSASSVSRTASPWVAIGALAVVAVAALLLAAMPDPPAPRGQRVRAGAGPVPVVATTTASSTYRSITPCRIVDTRQVSDPVAPGGSRVFRVRGSDGFEAQGGTAGGCGVPEPASSVMVSITAVDPSGSGFLRAGPAGTVPRATVLNYQPGVDISAGIDVALADPSTPSPLLVRAWGTATDVVVDVLGYHQQQLAIVVDASGQIVSATPGIVSVEDSSPVGGSNEGQFAVEFDRDVSGCTALASDRGGADASTAFADVASTIVYVYTVGRADASPISGANAGFSLAMLC